MTRIKRQLPCKIKNIRLVSENDEEYRAFLTNIQLQHFHLRKSNTRKYSDLIAYPLEEAVRKWIQRTGTGVSERILSYEGLTFKNRYEKRFNEIDVIYRLGDTIRLCEVKVSSSGNIVTKASNQLMNSYNILRQTGVGIELLLVHINLNPESTTMEFQPFNPDFLEMELVRRKIKKAGFYYLHLDPGEVFNWGVNEGIIENSDLLANALEEARQLDLKRQLRQQLLDARIPEDQWPENAKHKNEPIDDATHFIRFGDTPAPNLLAEKLKKALAK